MPAAVDHAPERSDAVSEMELDARRIWSLFVAMALVMLGNGLQGSLIGVRTQIEGFPSAVTGVVMAAYFAGFLGGSFLVPKFVAAVGHIRVFAALASAASTAALIHSIAVEPVTWALMRLLTGVCFAGLYVVAESWLNSAASNATRGRLLSIYMLVVLGGMAAGQLLLNLATPDGFELFVVSSVLISLAVVPISLVQAPAPEFELGPSTTLAELWRLSPLGVTAGLLTGAVNAAVLGMGPVYATQAGMSTARVTWFMAASLLGGLALQWPLGRLSDRFSRRRVVLAVSTAATVIALAAVTVDPSSNSVIVVAFVFGGLIFPMYSLAMSHVNDSVAPDKFVASAAGLLFVSGVGAVAGPLVVAGALAATGPDGYWWSMAMFYAPVALVAVYRLVRRARLDERRFVRIPLRASPVIGNVLRDLDERSPRKR